MPETKSTHTLSFPDRAALAAIVRSEGYRVLLDVMEAVCHEQDTRLINTDVRDEAGIVAEHRKAQAMWQIFDEMQAKVLLASKMHGEETAPDPDAGTSDEELADEQLLDPTRTYRPNPHGFASR